jgi:hypothetical protein
MKVEHPYPQLSGAPVLVDECIERLPVCSFIRRAEVDQIGIVDRDRIEGKALRGLPPEHDLFLTERGSVPTIVIFREDL